MSEQPTYEWHITVQRNNIYGDKVVAEFPAVFLASTRAEVTQKVRVAFDATYDEFRKFWSHGWVLRKIREVPPCP